jgi:hypothetical protein
MGGWRKLHNEELHNIHSLPNIIKNYEVKGSEIGRHVARMRGENECIYGIGGKARRKETTRKTKT